MGGLVSKPRVRWHKHCKKWVVIGCARGYTNSDLIVAIRGWYDKVYGNDNHGYR